MANSRLWKSFVVSRSASSQKSNAKSSKSVDLQPRKWPTEANDYEILEQIGEGAHAVVFRAHCKPFDVTVAIRKLDLDSNSHWDLSSLVREASLMKRFDHPAVLPLHTSFVSGRALWMVTPYMGQGSVRSIMMRQFPEGLQEVVIATIMKPVLLGLQYVHKNGGIHRDVKADNILMSETGRVVLGDFDVAASPQLREVSMLAASLAGGGGDLGGLRASTFVGTPCWMAPEVMQQADDGYNASADIWSFGITLMELAAGRPPRCRLHPLRLVADTISQPPPSLDDHTAEGRRFSKALKDVVAACLCKDPAKRPSASALLHHRFFKLAKDSTFLVSHFLAGVPAGPSSHRARWRQGIKDMMPLGSGRKASEWLFPTNLHLHGGNKRHGDADAAPDTAAAAPAWEGTLQQEQQQEQQQDLQQERQQVVCCKQEEVAAAAATGSSHVAQQLQCSDAGADGAGVHVLIPSKIDPAEEPQQQQQQQQQPCQLQQQQEPQAAASQHWASAGSSGGSKHPVGSVLAAVRAAFQVKKRSEEHAVFAVKPAML